MENWENLFVMDVQLFFFFFFQAEDGIRDGRVTGVQTCALPISGRCSWIIRNLLADLSVSSPPIDTSASTSSDASAACTVRSGPVFSGSSRSPGLFTSLPGLERAVDRKSVV